MKKLFIGFAFILISNVLNAQNPSWILPPNFIKFDPILPPQTSPLPTPTYMFGDPTYPVNGDIYKGYIGQLPTNASNIISNAQGEIEFFIVDEFVYDKDGNYIDHLRDEDGNEVKGASEIVIIPNPINCQQYYIVTSMIESGIYNKTPYVFLLDMSILNPNAYNTNNCRSYGALVELGSGTYPWGLAIKSIAPDFDWSDPSPGKKSNVFIAASDLTTNNERLVFVSNGIGIYRFKIGASGFTYENTVIPFPSPVFNPERSRSEMELVKLQSGNYRIAVPYVTSGILTGSGINGYSVWQQLYTAELNPYGNLIAGSIKQFPLNRENVSSIAYFAAFKGIEFSDDGQILYVTHSTNNIDTNPFEYYDFNNPTPDLLPITVAGGVNLRYSTLELGANNELYMANENGLYKMSTNASIPSGNLQSVSSFGYAPTHEGPIVDIDKKMYMLQDQIDGMDYSNYQFINQQCCMDNQPYDQLVFSATANATWFPSGNPLNGSSGVDVFIRDELRIPAGRTVTIQGMNLHFAPGARLVIENNSTLLGQGGKLILDGTTLTVDDRCTSDAMWLGVEVWGNQTLTQGNFGYSNQGRLELKNNSIIEHARIGALASKRQSSSLEVCPGVFETNILPNSFDNTRNGGIIISRNSSFLNNQIGVSIPKYYSPTNVNHLAQFRNTIFEWTGLLKDPSLTIQQHAKLTENNGVSFLGCDFFNSSPDSFDELNGQGIGIQASNATFYVNSYCTVVTPYGTPCPSSDRSVFKNLSLGILAFYFITPKAFYCENSTFTDCRYGIYTNNSNLIKVVKNNFEVRENSYQTAGLIIFNSTGYKVESNNLYEFDDVDTDYGMGNSYGIVVNNSGPLHNEIYRNRFRNLKIGGQTEKQNALQNGMQVPNDVNYYTMSGLIWQCNHFDFIYETDLNLVSGSIDWFQGNSVFDVGTPTLLAKRHAANNRFSLGYEDPLGAGFVPAHDLKSSDDSQQYQYTWIVGGNMYPDNISTNLLIQRDEIDFFPTITDTTGACPSKLIGKTKVQLKSERADIKEQIELLRAYLDKGDKEGLLSYIATWNDRNAVKNELLSASPYLSDEVLLAYINSNPPSAMLKDVMISNSPLSVEVKNLLATKNLPIGTKNQINAAQTGTSKRLVLFSEINYLEGVFSDSYYDLLRQDLFDTINVNAVDSLILTLQEEGTLDSKKMLLETYILKGDNAQADAIRSELVSLNTPTDLIELTDVIKVIRPLQATSWAFDNNPAMKTQVENIRDNSVHPDLALKAKILLETNENLENVPDFLVGVSNRSMQQPNQVNNSIETDVPLFVSIYPNPSTGIVNFDYPELGEGILSIQLLDLNGKEVYSQRSVSESNGERVDLSHIKKGLYLVRVCIDSEYIETQKLFLK